VLTFNSAVYSVLAIKKTAYRFGDRFYVTIDQPDDETIEVHLLAKSGPDHPAPRVDPSQVAGEFSNQLLDQDLRETVAAQTEGIRNLILAQAFSATSLLHPDLDIADPQRVPVLDPTGES